MLQGLSIRIESPWCAGIFLSSADFIKKCLDDLESNSLILDHVTCFVGLDLGPNCYQYMTKMASRSKVKIVPGREKT